MEVIWSTFFPKDQLQNQVAQCCRVLNAFKDGDWQIDTVLKHSHHEEFLLLEFLLLLLDSIASSSCTGNSVAPFPL